MEEMRKLVAASPELSFVQPFLNEHPDAELFLVGGAVRDLLMKRKMKDVDFDFVIRGLSHEEISAWFSTKGSIDFAGATFGVFKFMPTGTDPQTTAFIDIALPRLEQAHSDTAGGYKQFHVESDPSLLIEDDLSRRDFTINAMAINVRSGVLIDPFGGRKDLQDELVRAVGDADDRFAEDLSRMLRAIRFASELGFTIERETLDAIAMHIESIHLKQDDVYIVPRETVGLELAKALTRNPMGAGVWLDLSGAMSVLLPGVEQQAIERLKDVKPGNTELVVALLLSDLDPETAKHILIETGLNSLPKHSSMRIEVETILWGIERLKEATANTWIQGMRAHRFEKIFMNGRGAFMLSLLEHSSKASILKLARERKTLIEQRWSINAFEHIPPLVSGDDILAAGVEAGPRVRQILEHIRDEQLEGRVMTREEALRKIK